MASSKYRRRDEGREEDDAMPLGTEYCDFVEDNNRIYTSKKASVEVTVKVKKLRHKHDDEKSNKTNKRTSVSQNVVYPKGSWGDLLMSQRNKKEQPKEERKDKDKHQHDKVMLHKKEQIKMKCVEDGGNHPKSVCHKIPITSELYLETHTHVRSKSKERKVSPQPISKHKTKIVQDRKFLQSNKDEVDGHGKRINYEAQNDYLRFEVERLKQEMELIKQRSTQSHKKSPILGASGPSGDVGNTSIIKRVGMAINKNEKNKESGETKSQRDSRYKKISTPVPTKESKQTMTSLTNLDTIPSLISSRRQTGIMQSHHERYPEKLTPLKEVGTSVSQSESEVERETQLRLENEALRKEASELLTQMQKAKQDHEESIITIRELYQLAEMLKRENQQLIGVQEEQQMIQQKLVSAVSENKELKKYLDDVMQKHNESSQQKNGQMDKFEQIRSVIQEVKSTIQKEINEFGTTDSNNFAIPESLRALDLNTSDADSLLLNDTNASEIQKILGTYGVSQMHNSMEGVNSPAPPRFTPSPLQQQKITSTPGGIVGAEQERWSEFSTSQDEEIYRNLELIEEDIRNRSFKPIQNNSSQSDPSNSSTPTNQRYQQNDKMSY